MPYDVTSRLWATQAEAFYRAIEFQPQQQKGPHCVATALAIIASTTPQTFMGKINTQDPVSWSAALLPFGMKLAYCSSDVRRVEFYVPDLEALDDLFLVSYYSTYAEDELLTDPDEEGWICGSHVVVVHRDKAIDPATGRAVPLNRARARAYHTKRIFRVVPAEHSRGL